MTGELTQNWLPILNTTAELIPPGSLAKPDGIDATTGFLRVVKPTTDGDTTCLVVGTTQVVASGRGVGTFDTRVALAYDLADGTPAAGETWGSGAGSWAAKKTKAGFTILGGIAAGLVNAVRASGGGSLTVEAVDGTPSYPDTTTLRFDEADGFSLSQPSAGVVRVDFTGAAGSITVAAVYGTPLYTTSTLTFEPADGFVVTQPITGTTQIGLIPATATQAGIVSTAAQTWAGYKTFDDGIKTLRSSTYSLIAGDYYREALTVSAYDPGGSSLDNGLGREVRLFDASYWYDIVFGPYLYTRNANTGRLSVNGDIVLSNKIVMFGAVNAGGLLTTAELNSMTCQWVSSGTKLQFVTTAFGLGLVAEYDAAATVWKFWQTVEANTKFRCNGIDGLSITTGGATFTGGILTSGTISAGITSIGGSTPTSLTGYLKGNGSVVSAQAVPIPIADGGTGGTTAAAARTALGAGTVSSVGLTMPGGFTVTSSPVTSSGTLAVTLTGEVERTGAARLYGTAGGNGYLDLWDNGSGAYRRIVANINGFSFDGIGGFTGVTLANPLAVSYGGTGASSASGARTNLGLAYATQTEQETGTATDRVVAPGTQQFHPSAAKAWVCFTVSGTTVAVQASYNVMSVTRNGVGDYTVNFTTAFSAANYSAVATAGLNQVSSYWCVVSHRTLAAGSYRCQCSGLDNNVYDPRTVTVAFFGDQ